jgi:hypothetical protein
VLFGVYPASRAARTRPHHRDAPQRPDVSLALRMEAFSDEYPHSRSTRFG